MFNIWWYSSWCNFIVGCCKKQFVDNCLKPPLWYHLTLLTLKTAAWPKGSPHEVLSRLYFQSFQAHYVSWWMWLLSKVEKLLLHTQEPCAEYFLLGPLSLHMLVVCSCHVLPVSNNHTVFTLDLAGHCGKSVQWEISLGPPVLDRHICAGGVSWR